jgi:hypothetical protein
VRNLNTCCDVTDYSGYRTARFVNVIDFYLVLFYLILQSNFTFVPIHVIVPKKSLIRFYYYYSIFGIIVVNISYCFSLHFVRRRLFPFYYFGDLMPT